MSAAEDSQPDFHFSCHRCGNCCRVGQGQVWFEERDLPAMAEALAMTVEAFTRQFVRRVGSRLSLREHPDGNCMMLEGPAHCSIYDLRPKQCRDFPFWPQLEESEDALKKAASYCPGIQRFPNSEVAASVLRETARLLDLALATQEESTSSAASQEGERWGSSLEVDLYLATALDRRIHHPPLLEQLRRDLEALAERSGYPWSVAPWERLLADRRKGWLALGGLPTLA